MDPLINLNTNQLSNDLINNLFSGLFASVITFIISTFYTIYRDNMQRKIEKRAYLRIDDIYDSEYKLQNLDVEGYKKIIITPNYEEILDNNPYDRTFNFIRIKNLGPGHIINFNIKITMKLVVNDKKWVINAFVPFIEEKEEIYICVDSLQYPNEFCIMEKIEAEYNTIVGEKMKYVSNVRKEGEENIVNEIYFIKRFCRYKELNKICGKRVEWILTKPKNKK